MSSSAHPEVVLSSAIALPIAQRARRRVRRRLLPFLFVLYVIAYLDRVNVSYAALEMTGSLGFTPEVYGFGAGIFFFGYFLLEIPGTIVVAKWSARRCMEHIMVSGGGGAVCAGVHPRAGQFHCVG